MELDRKRPSEGPVPDAKRSVSDATGPVTADEIELFQKEAIFRQMNAYKRERDELQSQLNAIDGGDEKLREELAELTQKYVAAVKQVERLTSRSVARVMRQGQSEDSDASATSSATTAAPNGTEASSRASSEDGKLSSSTSAAPGGGGDSKELLEARSNLAAAEGEVQKLKDFIAIEDKKRSELEVKIRNLEEQLARAPSGTNALEIKLKEAHAETQRLVVETQNLQQQIADLKGSQAEYEQQVRDRTSTQIQSLERRLTAAEADVSRIRSARDDLLSEVNILKAESAEHRNEASRLKELVDLNASSATAVPSSAVANEAAAVPATPAAAEELPTDVDALRERCLSLIRQNKALAEEISGLEQGFAMANSKAKAALKATMVAEQKLGVLNTAKVRSDEKYIGAMRTRDSLNQELARTKQALTKSAEVVSDQKSLEQNLTAQVARLQKQVAQLEVVIRQRQVETDAIRRAKQESDSQLESARAVQEKLREQITSIDEEKTAAVVARRAAETSAQKLQSQLDTQRAISGFGSAGEVQEQLESLRSIAMCPVCQKNWKDRAIATCGHTLCADCVQSRLAARMRKCPMCNGHFASNDVLPIHL